MAIHFLKFSTLEGLFRMNYMGNQLSEKITIIWKVKIKGGNKKKEYLKIAAIALFLGKKNLTIGKEKK